ncbi:Uncharacterised protein [Mycobacteroides abscessus subsp. abscessus]|nr:Uncharacterised protein [Mycobacteroides abscessus subsp. abscessus]
MLAGAILTLVYTRIYVIDPHWGGFTPIGRWIVVASLVPLAVARFLCRNPLSPTADQAMDKRALAHSAR